MRFEWDPAKNVGNKRKHRVAFEIARNVFADPARLEGDITEDEYGEERWEAVGRPDPARDIVLSVIFTPRPSDIVRIISARKADPEDEQSYYAQFPRT